MLRQIKITYEQLYEDYVVQRMGVRAIGKKHNLSNSVVVNHLKYFKIPVRTHAEGIKIAVDEGRITSPTKGRNRTPEEIALITRRTEEALWSVDDDVRAERSERARQRYSKFTDEQRENLRRNNRVSISQSSRRGSKMELHLVARLRLAGHRVEFHKKFLFNNENMHVDIFLPDLDLAIEVDGPTHTRPIYGEEDFERRKKLDAEKNMKLLDAGLKVMRLGVSKSNTKYLRHVKSEEVLNYLEVHSKKLPAIVYLGDYNGN